MFTPKAFLNGFLSLALVGCLALPAIGQGKTPKTPPSNPDKGSSSGIQPFGTQPAGGARGKPATFRRIPTIADAQARIQQNTNNYLMQQAMTQAMVQSSIVNNGMPFQSNIMQSPFQQQMMNPWQQQMNPWQQQMNPWQQQMNPWSQQMNPWQQQMNPWQQQMNPWQQQMNPWQQQMNPWQQQMNPWQQQMNPWQQQMNPWQQQMNPWQQQMMFGMNNNPGLFGGFMR